jgi:integrase
MTAIADKKPDDLLFPGQRIGSPLADTSFRMLFDRMNVTGITTHGFRSRFKDWAAECTSFPNELSEMALAHVIGNQTEAAYRRGDMFERRRRLMEAWEKYCLMPSKVNSPAA